MHSTACVVLNPFLPFFLDIAVAEMTGISKASGIPLGEIYLYNLFYEFNAFCTSIISENVDGQIYHARNMDFGLFMGWDTHNDTWLLTEKLRPLVVNVEYVKNNQTLFKAVNFVGYIGVITGVKPQKFSLSVNERYSLKGSGLAGILKWILGSRTGNWMGFLTRTVFETVESFADAKAVLSSKPLVGPIYFILGRNRFGILREFIALFLSYLGMTHSFSCSFWLL